MSVRPLATLPESMRVPIFCSSGGCDPGPEQAMASLRPHLPAIIATYVRNPPNWSAIILLLPGQTLLPPMHPSSRPATVARHLVLASALIVAVVAPPAQADVWKFVDRHGVVHLSDRPMGPGSELLVRGKKRVKKSRVAGRSALADLKVNERRYTQLIDKVSRELSLDRNLIHAVVRVESAFDPQAVSRAGAVGLMQLMPGTAQRYGVRDSRNPTQNVYAGVLHLRKLIQQFNDVVLALAAYNAGENAVINYGYKVPPYPETQNYVRKVLTFYRQYSNRNSAS